MRCFEACKTIQYRQFIGSKLLNLSDNIINDRPALLGEALVLRSLVE